MQQIKEIEECYKYPIIVYADINSNVHGEKYKEVEKKLRGKNWISHKSEEWTRKGNAN